MRLERLRVEECEVIEKEGRRNKSFHRVEQKKTKCVKSLSVDVAGILEYFLLLLLRKYTIIKRKKCGTHKKNIEKGSLDPFTTAHKKLLRKMGNDEFFEHRKIIHHPSKKLICKEDKKMVWREQIATTTKFFFNFFRKNKKRWWKKLFRNKSLSR